MFNPILQTNSKGQKKIYFNCFMHWSIPAVLNHLGIGWAFAYVYYSKGQALDSLRHLTSPWLILTSCCTGVISSDGFPGWNLFKIIIRFLMRSYLLNK